MSNEHKRLFVPKPPNVVDFNAAASRLRFPLIPFDEIKVGSERKFIVKGLIPQSGLTVVWGPPKSGKSFWTFDLAMHIALGWAYRGRRVHKGPVIYCAFEGQSGIKARAEAFRLKHIAEESEQIPFYLQPLGMDLVRDKSFLITSIKETLGETAPVAVVFDTLNRSLNGSESRDEDMAAYVKAADAVREAFDCAVIIVHHCGVSGDRPRGHTSLTGAADAQLKVQRDAAGVITVTVEWMKDGGSEGETIGSTLESVEVSLDEDGEPITSCVIIEAEPSAPPSKANRLPANHATMLSLLKEAGKDGLTVEEWNDKGRAQGIGVKRHATFHDIRTNLKDKQLAHSYADRWYAN